MVLTYIRESMSQPRTADEADRLDELGIDSLKIFAVLVMLEQEFRLDINRMAEAKSPMTVEDLIDIAIHSLPGDGSRAG
jgi:acyl carrier protein